MGMRVVHIYLDESGDLGFNFAEKNPSRYFVITLLVCKNALSAIKIKKAVERTLKNKVVHSTKYKFTMELKGAHAPLSIKKYFYRNAVKATGWKIYSIILDKNSAYKNSQKPINIHRLYNVLANHLIQQVDFLTAKTVNLFVDKSKNRSGILEFDLMLKNSLDLILPLNVPVNIMHVNSQHYYGIQAVDLFCWGIFRKYTQRDESWFRVFEEKVVFEHQFVAQKKTAPTEALIL